MDFHFGFFWKKSGLSGVCWKRANLFCEAFGFLRRSWLEKRVSFYFEESGKTFVGIVAKCEGSLQTRYFGINSVSSQKAKSKNSPKLLLPLVQFFGCDSISQIKLNQLSFL